MRSLGHASARMVLMTGALAAVALTGCAAPDDSEGGMGLPVVEWLDAPATGGSAVTGVLRVADNGCFHLESGEEHFFVVWPDGFKHDGAQVRTGDGTVIADGDEVSGTGTVLPHADAVEAAGGDSQLGQAIAYCAEGTDILVLTTVTGG